MDLMVYLIVKRGILAPNCQWMKISNILLRNDENGIKFYQKLAQSGKIVKVNIYGTDVYVITHLPYIRQTLDNSPDIFGVGKFKYNFFKTFMKYNVGVSSGCPWKEKRILNEKTLYTDKHHPYLQFYDKYINELLNKKIPINFQDFNEFAKKITSYIVFGQKTEVPDYVFDTFTKANQFKSILADNPIKISEYYSYLEKNIDHPQKNSLIELAVQSIKKPLSKHQRMELIHQIPHWIFPIMNAFITLIPRTLLLLCNNPRILNNIRAQNNLLIRQSILETLRLNNPVTSLFRTLLHDYQFDDHYKFKKGTQFLILTNPILRDNKYFPDPNKFKPQRWNPLMEKQYYSIMFSQGPQKCPGKEFVIDLVSIFLKNYLKMVKHYKCHKIDNNYIPQLIDPCKIAFTIPRTNSMNVPQNDHH